MNFSRRTSWPRQPNKLTTLGDRLISQGTAIVDLTISNPTKCGFDYTGVLPLATVSKSLVYSPHPQGLLSARESIADYYHKKKIQLDPARIFLTSGSSEAYSHIFKLLCNYDDIVLVPRPSYPLFDYLADLNDVHLLYYNLIYDGEWHVDLDSLIFSIDKYRDRVKAIILVNPHNPTGMFLKQDEYRSIQEIVRSRSLALIVDEVFIDYPFNDDPNRLHSAVEETTVLTFTVNGISKSCGLPQIKIGWIVVGGPPQDVDETIARFEIICDTYLSVNIPAQLSLPFLFTAGLSIREQILKRALVNYHSLIDTVGAINSCSIPRVEGGWYAILRIPHIKSDERWALELLENKGTYVQPGYFFDFINEGYLVVSLLSDVLDFQKGIHSVIEHITNC